MDLPTKVWIEVDVKEDEDGTVSFSGLVTQADLDSLIRGEFPHDFLKLEQVFWVKTKKSDEVWIQDENILVKYGYGKYVHYQGDLYVRKELIIEISPLKGGPELVEFTDS